MKFALSFVEKMFSIVYNSTMKIIAILLVLFPILVFAQKKRIDDENPDGLRNKLLKLDVSKVAGSNPKLPYAAIEVLDNRFDTSKIGFTLGFQLFNNIKRAGRKMIFDNSVAKALENYYNEFYQNSFTPNNITLFIVLKKLWFSGIDNSRNKEIDILRNTTSEEFLYCKWEYYLKRGNEYLPVKRTDTVINGVIYETNGIDYQNELSNNEILKLMLEGMVELVDLNKAVADFDNANKLSWEKVKAYNASFYDWPILKDTMVNKGVYLTFNEFRNNKPSIRNFSEKKLRIRIGKEEDYIEDNQGNRISNYWGYYNGNEWKIGKYGNDKMFRKGNAFEFFSKTKTAAMSTNRGNTYGSTNNEAKPWMPYQIDMETGLIY